MTAEENHSDTCCVKVPKDRFVLTLPLAAAPEKKAKLDRVFQAANNFKNALISNRKKAFRELRKTRIWRSCADALNCRKQAKKECSAGISKCRTSIDRLRTLEKKAPLTASQNRKLSMLQTELKALEDRLALIAGDLAEVRSRIRNLREEHGFLGEYSFHHIAAEIGGHFDGLLGADIKQKTASDVWKSFAPYFQENRYKEDESVSFSPSEELSSIEGKKANANIIFKEAINSADPRLAGCVKIAGMEIPVRCSRSDPYGYEHQALRHAVCYCRIIRKAYPEGWRYFLQLVLKGDPPKKPTRQLGTGNAGIDIGPRTAAICGQKVIRFEKLADGAQDLEKKIREINMAMDRSRRETNPKMFGTDGQIIRVDKLPAECVRKKKNGSLKRKWVRSRRYRKLERMRRYLYRKQRELRKLRHRELIRDILPMADTFHIEHMDWRALHRRAKKTAKKKNGRYASKKRFGRSIANCAPALFVTLLAQELTLLGGRLIEIDTKACKASQYDHTNGICTKKKLGERWANLSDGNSFQRDIYSAWLIAHVNADGKTYDAQALDSEYDDFKLAHDSEIRRLKALDTKLPFSMGIR